MYLPALTDRASLAVNCLVNHCDRSRGYLPYFYTRLSDRPLSATLSIWSYGDGLGRSVDALGLLRHMTGASMDGEADRALIASLISLINADGLSWCPAEPWALRLPHTRPAWLQQGTLLGLTTLHQLTADDDYRVLAERNIEAVTRMARFNEDGTAEFPGDAYTRADGWVKWPEDPAHRFSVFSTSITMPLMRYCRLTGYEPALRLASGLMAWALGDHDGGTGLFEFGHFHCQSRLVTALLLRGVVTGNAADMELGEQLYLKARGLGTRSGWFPEQINNPEHNRSNLAETCCLTDMIEAAILLAQHRDVTYWNDVERFVRNHLLVHQITDVDWFEDLTYVPAVQHPLGFDLEEATGDAGGARGDHLKDSLRGAFAGWGAVTAMSDDSMFANSNQHCCNAAGGRALYDVWRYAVDDDGADFRINLHLHRDHAAATVVVDEGEAEAPGCLRIEMKQRRRLSVRVPEGVDAREMRATCNGVPVVGEPGAFLGLGEVQAGDCLEIYYPMKVSVTREAIAPGTFTFHWRGLTVMRAEPVQKIRALFGPERFCYNAPPPGVALGKEIDSL
jgi:hypothetical protein